MIRLIIGFALFNAGLSASAEPLIKPPTVPKTATRVTYPLVLTSHKNGHYIKGYLPTGSPAKGKKGPGQPARVGLTTLSEMAVIAVHTLKELGYNAVAGQPFVMPSVTLVGEAKLSGERTAVQVTLKNVKVDVVTSFYGKEDNVNECDILIGLNQLLLTAPGQAELWMHFDENARVEVTYPATAVKKADAEEELGPEPSTPAEPSENSVPLKLTLSSLDYSFAVSQLNGKTTPLKPRTTRFEIRMTARGHLYGTTKLANDYGMKVVKDDGDMQFVGEGKTKIAAAEVTNLRLPGLSSAGGKTTGLDLFMENLKLQLDTEAQHHSLFAGPGLLGQHMTNLTLAVGTDGIPRLYGYAAKTSTLDPKVKK